eukprot:6198421-Pleurochrysis_carterae.AAC.4
MTPWATTKGVQVDQGLVRQGRVRAALPVRRRQGTAPGCARCRSDGRSPWRRRLGCNATCAWHGGARRNDSRRQRIILTYRTVA